MHFNIRFYAFVTVTTLSIGNKPLPIGFNWWQFALKLFWQILGPCIIAHWLLYHSFHKIRGHKTSSDNLEIRIMGGSIIEVLLYHVWKELACRINLSLVHQSWSLAAATNLIRIPGSANQTRGFGLSQLLWKLFIKIDHWSPVKLYKHFFVV